MNEIPSGIGVFQRWPHSVAFGFSMGNLKDGARGSFPFEEKNSSKIPMDHLLCVVLPVEPKVAVGYAFQPASVFQFCAKHCIVQSRSCLSITALYRAEAVRLADLSKLKLCRIGQGFCRCQSW